MDDYSSQGGSLLPESDDSAAQYPAYRHQHSISLTDEVQYRVSEDSLPPPQPTLHLERTITVLTAQIQQLQWEKQQMSNQIEALHREIKENRKEIQEILFNSEREKTQLTQELDKYRNSRSPRAKEVHLQLIQDLENDLKALTSRINTKNSPKSVASTGRKRSKSNENRLISAISAVLHTNKAEILAKIEEIVQENEEKRKFLGQIAGLVKKYSPPGAFPYQPSNSQVWDWISRLLVEYMDLKRTLKYLRSRLSELTQVAEPTIERELRELVRRGPRLDF